MVIACSTTDSLGVRAEAGGVLAGDACWVTDATGNCLPVAPCARTPSEAANARLNAAPASLFESVFGEETVDFPRFPNSLAMSDPI